MLQVILSELNCCKPCSLTSGLVFVRFAWSYDGLLHSFSIAARLLIWICDSCDPARSFKHLFWVNFFSSLSSVVPLRSLHALDTELLWWVNELIVVITAFTAVIAPCIVILSSDLLDCKAELRLEGFFLFLLGAFHKFEPHYALFCLFVLILWSLLWLLVEFHINFTIIAIFIAIFFTFFAFLAAWIKLSLHPSHCLLFQSLMFIGTLFLVRVHVFIIALWLIWVT